MCWAKFLAAALFACSLIVVAVAQQKGTSPTKTTPSAAAKKPATTAQTPAAQTPAAKTPTQKASPQQAKQPAKPRLSPEQVAKKNEILNSDRFREAKAVFEQWLTVQKAYTKQQVPQLKAEFRRKIQWMTPAELEQFLGEMEGKLNVLMSSEAKAARDWLGYFVSAKAILPAEEVDKFDIVHMTPEQLEQTIGQVQAKRGALGQASSAFNTQRQAQVQAAREKRQRDDSARQARREASRQSARANAPSSPSPYAPPKRFQGPQQGRTSYYVSPWGGVGLLINP